MFENHNFLKTWRNSKTYFSQNNINSFETLGKFPYRSNVVNFIDIDKFGYSAR